MKRQFILLFVALLVAVPVSASTFVAMQPSQLVAEADAIVVAQVIDRVSSWTESGRLIYTDNTLAIEEILVGEAAATVTVRTFGGQVGDITVEAHGFPQLADGERVLLFLTHDQDVGATRVLGYQQGHFRIVTRLDGVTLAVPQIDARFVDVQGRPMAEPRSMPFGQFKAEILKTAAQLGRFEAR